MRALCLASLIIVAAGCPEVPADRPDAGSEGEGEGEGEGERQDAGPDPDPDVVGLDARPGPQTCTAPARPVDNTDFALVRPYPSLQLSAPLYMLPRPGDDEHLYVIERQGRVVRFRTDDATVTSPEVFCDLRDRVRSGGGNSEQGLLGIAFHPDHAQNGELYLSYTASNDNDSCPFQAPRSCPFESRVSRFATTADGCTLASEETLIDIDDFAGNHNGGHILFDVQGMLVLGMGDGGNADDPIRAGQDTSTLLGKMLRIDVDTAQAPRAYGIPADNPFVGADDPDDDVLDEIWATGLRNPWRFSIDRATDTMWVGDVGQNRIEEIAIVRAGQNHGWSVFEGNDCFRGDAACNVGGFTAPVVTYAHAQGRVSVTGGFVYRGSALPDLVGTYLFADFGSKEVFALTTNPDGTAGFERKVTMSGGGIASFAEDANGELWLVDLAGPLFRLDPAGPPVVDTFPRLLSETGCVDDADRRQLAPSVVPYGLNHPFYSDGADKHRGVAIPDGTVAAVVESGDDAGQIALPTGSVLVKHFEVDGVPVETRTLVRHDDGEWAGYSYEWGVTDGDAVLVDPAGKTKVLSTGQTWVYPSRAGCLSCHTAAAGRVLGLELQQQNGGFVYPNGRFANQLRTLAHIGYVPAEVDDDLAALPALPPPDLASVDVSARARAYLHVNCSMCHRPGGGGQSQADLRIDRTLTQTNICDRVPEEGDFGVENARVLAPGDPARSLLSVRMKRLAPGRMPLLGSTVVDTTGTDLVDRFITTTSACD